MQAVYIWSVIITRLGAPSRTLRGWQRQTSKRISNVTHRQTHIRNGRNDKTHISICPSFLALFFFFFLFSRLIFFLGVSHFSANGNAMKEETQKRSIQAERGGARHSREYIVLAAISFVNMIKPLLCILSSAYIAAAAAAAAGAKTLFLLSFRVSCSPRH